MRITPQTQCCISIAARPGNFGATIFNAAFKVLNLDYIYIPRKVEAGDLGKAIDGIRALGIRGCGVSMPHKSEALRYLDHIDPVAKEIGAVNTIVNNAGVLTGYNTDVVGAEQALAEQYDVSGKRVIVFGAGGAARAICVALKKLHAGEILVSNRDELKGRQFAKEFSLSYYPFNERNECTGDLLVNATPVGMAPHEREMIIQKDSLGNYKAVLDIVIYPKTTQLLGAAAHAGLITISGAVMALHQAARQFTLYTGQEAPLDIMRETMVRLYQ